MPAEIREAKDVRLKKQLGSRSTKDNLQDIDDNARSRYRKEQKRRNRRARAHPGREGPQSREQTAPLQYDKAQSGQDQIAVGQPQPPSQLEQRAQIRVSGVKEQCQRTIDGLDRDYNQDDCSSRP